MPEAKPAIVSAIPKPPSERGGLTSTLPDQSPCFDCGIPTTPCSGKRGCRHKDKWEWYRVQDEVWQAAGMNEGFLCIDCLEKRLGRKLNAVDFADSNLLTDHPWDTPRLRERKHIE